MTDHAESITIAVSLGEEPTQSTVVAAQTHLLSEPWIKMTTADRASGSPYHVTVAVKHMYRDRLRTVEDRIREILTDLVPDLEPLFSVRINDHPVWEDHREQTAA